MNNLLPTIYYFSQVNPEGLHYKWNHGLELAGILLRFSSTCNTKLLF